jgi:hypothetical protein
VSPKPTTAQGGVSLVKKACTVSVPAPGGIVVIVPLVDPSLLVAVVVHCPLPDGHVFWVPTKTSVDPLLGLVNIPPE